MYVLALIVVAAVVASNRSLGGPGKCFCKNFGIPQRWPDHASLDRHLARAGVIRVILGAGGLCIGFLIAANAPVAKGVFASVCTASSQTGNFAPLPHHREILGARRIAHDPNWVRGTLPDRRYRSGCPVTEQLQTIVTGESVRRRGRQAVLGPLGFLIGYVLGIWLSERRPKVLALSDEVELKDEPEAIRSGSRWISNLPTPAYVCATFAVVLALGIAPMEGLSALVAIGLSVLFGAVVFSAFRGLGEKAVDARPGSITSASLERRRIGHYASSIICILIMLWIATLLVVFCVSLFSGLDYPYLSTSSRYEPVAVVTMLSIITVATLLVAQRIVSAPKPFSRNQAAAAVVDDARRVQAVQRLALALIVLGLTALQPVSSLWKGFPCTGLLFGLRDLALTVAVIHWIAGPYAPKLIVDRWLRVVRSARSSELIATERMADAP
jgi:hypothetical protein